jgi:hypothetical protein
MTKRTPNRTKVALNAYVDPAIVERLERYIASQPLRPSKTAMIELGLTRLLDDLTGEAQPPTASASNKRGRKVA